MSMLGIQKPIALATTLVLLAWAPAPSAGQTATPQDVGLLSWGMGLSYMLNAAALAESWGKACSVGRREDGEHIKTYVTDLVAYCAKTQPDRTNWKSLSQEMEAAYSSYLRSRKANLDQLGTVEFCRLAREGMELDQEKPKPPHKIAGKLVHTVQMTIKERSLSGFAASDCPEERQAK